MATQLWDADDAVDYDRSSPDMFDPDVLGPTVDLLADLAGDGRALELAVGTGRVALPLAARGTPMHGIELSPHMVEQLRAKPGGAELPVTIGDMTCTRVDGDFTLVYLVFNTIMNVTTQDEQVAVFANAAAHLRPGGAFVVEKIVPGLRQLPPGQTVRPFDIRPGHLGFEEFTDLTEKQIAWSHHHTVQPDGSVRATSAPYRFAWPAELDLMARLAGMTLQNRWADWRRAPFTGDSPAHVSVYRAA